MCVKKKSSHSRHNAETRTIRDAKDVFGVARRRTTCPYDYEIRDGHMFIEGEDFGDCKEFFAKGRLLRELTMTLHQIAIA